MILQVRYVGVDERGSSCCRNCQLSDWRLTSYVMAAAMMMKIASLQLAAMAIGCLGAQQDAVAASSGAAKEQQIPEQQRAGDKDVSH